MKCPLLKIPLTLFRRRLPPKDTDLLMVDEDGGLWAGRFLGKNRVYDFRIQRATDRRGYHVNMTKLNPTYSKSRCKFPRFCGVVDHYKVKLVSWSVLDAPVTQ